METVPGPLVFPSLCVCVRSVVSNSLRPHRLWSPQAPLSMEFPRLDHCSGLPFPSPGDLPNPEIKLVSPASPGLAGGFLTTSTTWEACVTQYTAFIWCFSFALFFFPSSWIFLGLPPVLFFHSDLLPFSFPKQ